MPTINTGIRTINYGKARLQFANNVIYIVKSYIHFHDFDFLFGNYKVGHLVLFSQVTIYGGMGLIGLCGVSS